jgi:hypothetical protein
MPEALSGTSQTRTEEQKEGGDYLLLVLVRDPRSRPMFVCATGLWRRKLSMLDYLTWLFIYTKEELFRTSVGGASVLHTVVVALQARAPTNNGARTVDCSTR